MKPYIILIQLETFYTNKILWDDYFKIRKILTRFPFYSIVLYSDKLYDVDIEMFNEFLFGKKIIYHCFGENCFNELKDKFNIVGIIKKENNEIKFEKLFMKESVYYKFKKLHEQMKEDDLIPTLIAKWLKTKGESSIEIQLDQILLSVPQYDINRFFELEYIPGIPRRILKLIKLLCNQKYSGATIFHNGKWFSVLEDGRLAGNAKIPNNIYFVCLPENKGVGYGYWIDPKDNKVYIDYVKTYFSKDLAIKAIKQYPEINKTVFYIEDGRPYFVSFEEFIKEVK